MLDTQELELFSHYLSHTSRIIPYDSHDAYALQVGFPNLAFGNRPLMSSILALAAACECHDLLQGAQPQPQLDPATLARAHELLAVAERHHGASLGQTRAALPTTRRYDCVLASAALMVLYGSASHCLRIRLLTGMRFQHGVVHKEGADEQPFFLGDLFAPVQSQWIFLIRAVHLAYVGLVADGARSAGGGGTSTCAVASVPSPSAPPPPSRDFHVTDPGGAEVNHPPEDGPTEATRKMFLPIVATTSGAAMAKLRARARRARGGSSSTQEQLQACGEALVMLDRTMRRIRAAVAEGDGNGPRLDDDDDSGLEQEEEELAEQPALLPDVVAPWLRTYIARVTSNERCSSSPLRRTVNAFLNCVPAPFVELVQAVLDGHAAPVDQVHPSTSSFDGQGAGLREGGGGLPDGTEAARRLALDIFAHWLVLVLLLDGVWWIGEIGSWELAKVVALARDRRWFSQGMDEEEGGAWWPEGMYKINAELKRHST